MKNKSTVVGEKNQHHGQVVLTFGNFDDNCQHSQNFNLSYKYLSNNVFSSYSYQKCYREESEVNRKHTYTYTSIGHSLNYCFSVYFFLHLFTVSYLLGFFLEVSVLHGFSSYKCESTTTGSHSGLWEKPVTISSSSRLYILTQVCNSVVLAPPEAHSGF